ncbi:MAG: hypothetical protein WCA78_10490 [Rhizomicrobium sp.]
MDLTGRYAAPALPSIVREALDDLEILTAGPLSRKVALMSVMAKRAMEAVA